MREFVNAYTFANSANLSFIVGGFYWDGAGIIINAWTQQRLVVKLDSDGQCDHMDVEITAGLGLPEEITVVVRVSFAYGNIQYCDITDVLRSVIDRTMRSAIADTSTRGFIKITQKDAGDNTIDEPYKGEFGYYDAIVMSPSRMIQPASYQLLPDTFRLPSSITSFKPQGCTRMTGEAGVIRLLNSAGTVVGSVTSNKDQRTYGWGFQTLGQIAEVRILDAGGGIVERARVVWESECLTDKMLLTWWSPVTGGWKSVLADVMRHGDNIGNTQDYLLYFDNRQAKSGKLGWEVRIPNCTLRDYEYYRDIFYSDNVFVHELVIYDTSNSPHDIMHTVKVGGTPPNASVNGTTDITLDITMQEVSSIW